MGSGQSWEKDRFSDTYKAYNATLYQIFLLRLRNRQEAEDTVQEAFLKLYRAKPDSFESDTHIKTWMIRCVINLCRDMRKGFWNRNVNFMNDLTLLYEDRHDMLVKERNYY